MSKETKPATSPEQIKGLNPTPPIKEVGGTQGMNPTPPTNPKK